jgi:hypothetical protein
MERVLWPMEPVEPRMAIFFTVLFSQIEGRLHRQEQTTTNTEILASPE